MKLILFCLINIAFSNALSEWIDLNRHIIDSKSYKMSFNQELQSTIGGLVHFDLDTSTNVVFFKNKIRYESSNKIIIINQDSLKLLNKKSNQLFIDHIDESYSLLLDLNPIKILAESQFINSKDNGYYYIKYDGFTNLRLYLSNGNISLIKILSNNINIELSNINLFIIDTANVKDYFKINESSLSIFDLRTK